MAKTRKTPKKAGCKKALPANDTKRVQASVKKRTVSSQTHKGGPNRNPAYRRNMSYVVPKAAAEYEHNIGSNRIILVTSNGVTVRVGHRDESGQGEMYSRYFELTLSRFQNLIEAVPKIDDAVSQLRQGYQVDFLQHIGGPMFVTVNSRFAVVDIRRFFEPQGANFFRPKAGKPGLSLRQSEWRNLVDLINDMSEFLKLDSIIPCKRSHPSELEENECHECEPFPGLKRNIREAERNAVAMGFGLSDDDKMVNEDDNDDEDDDEDNDGLPSSKKKNETLKYSSDSDSDDTVMLGVGQNTPATVAAH